MSPRLFFTLLLREFRGSTGRVIALSLCLATGVAGVSGVRGLVNALEAGIRAQSRELLAADISVRSRRELPQELLDAVATEAPAEVSQLVEMASVLSVLERASGASNTGINERLVELRAVEGNYPLYGALDLSPQQSLRELLDDQSVVAAEALVSALDVELGDTLAIGGKAFNLVGVVRADPERLDFSLALGPRVYLSKSGLDRAQLISFGSRVRTKLLLRFEGDPNGKALAATVERLQSAVPQSFALRFETHTDAQPNLRRGLARFESYLGLLALTSLLLGGVGVAQITRAWLAARTKEVAVLRSLGMRPIEVLVLHLGQVLVLAFIGSSLGAMLGGAVPWFLPHLAPDLFPPSIVQSWQPGAMLQGLAVGLSVAACSALPPLGALWKIPPMRVLRSDADPLRTPFSIRLGLSLLVAAGIFGCSYWIGGNLELAGWFTGLTAAAGLLLGLASRSVLFIVGRMPRSKLHPLLWHGLAATARPSAGTTGAVVALGLGVMVITSVALIQNKLSSELSTALPAEAPSVFLPDVQPDQWQGLQVALSNLGAENQSSVPVVMARLAHIDGKRIDDILGELGGDPEKNRSIRWSYTREQRLTWMDEFPDSNTFVEGSGWNDPLPNELSLEVDYAENLGVKVGSRIGFDVQGIELEFVVTSLREIEWRSFGINFFLVAEPGSLEGAPHNRLAAARIDAERDNELMAVLAANYSNVTPLFVRAILERLLALFSRLAMGVRILGSFAVITGLVVLAGAVGATGLRRGREAALLKVLGLTRARVMLLFSAEYALQGAIAGSIGSIGALALAHGFLTRVLEFDSSLPLWTAPAAITVTALLAVAAGIAATGKALASPPWSALRR